MNWGFVAVAAVLAALGALCLWFVKRNRGEIALMASTETSCAADVAKLAPGTVVEVKGTIRCAAPLTGKFSQQPCIYMQSIIDRKETRRRDGGGTETHYVTESDDRQHIPFEVEDESGRVRIEPHGASIEAREVFNQQQNSLADNLVTLASTFGGGGSNAHRYREMILSPNIPVYVLGTVLPGGAIGQAAKGAAVSDFIITYESEEERTASAGSTIKWLNAGAAILFVAAIACIYFAFRYAPK